jgi:octopine/nopaline transport system permease protein
VNLIELFTLGPGGWGDEMLRGAVMTLVVAVSGFIAGLPFGMACAWAKLSRSRLLRFAGGVYTTIVRGVPELLVIYLLFFGGSGVFLKIAQAIGLSGSINVDAIGAGVLSIAVIAGAYLAEAFRGGMLAIPRGQSEAALAFGMPRRLAFRRVLLPQMVRLALPSIGNIWLLTLKDTALISVTGLVELLRTTDLVAGSTRMPFTFYMSAILLYLGLTSFSTLAFRSVEDRLARPSQPVSAQ